MREGNLEAPTRHPLDWKSDAFYDEGAAFKELERVFDICHGCRRCVNLCTAFPTLFDLVDASSTLEVDGVAKQDYWKVVDQCYLCDTCYMTKCPYVPPHPWNVDFPHLMLRAKAIKFRKGEVSFRDRLLSSTDAMGKLNTIPVVVQTVNAINKNGFARNFLHETLGVHKDRQLPEYASAKFRSSAVDSKAFEIKNGKHTPGKVAIFSTCYVNYNEPGLGHDLLALLAHNAIPYVLLEKEACCGMPKLELGDLSAVSELKNKNIPGMAKLAGEGYAILTPIPSCTLMFKQELPLMFPEDAEVKAVQDAMFDPFEYFVLRARDGLLKKDFKTRLGKVSYHIPCHSRVQNVGQKTREMLQMVPGTDVTTVERCAGHDGTWGVKKEYFENSMKIGRPVFRALAAAEPDWISSDCPIAARHISQGIRQEKNPLRRHTLSRCCARPTESKLLAALAFALLGDVPYSQYQADLLDGMIDRINAEPLAFVVHVGDITSGTGPCSDAWLEARRKQFARFQAPFVLLPGDNEWTDCHRTGFDALERLAKWRSLFCVPVESLSVERQKGKYCENVRWVHDHFVFVGLNIPGSNNNLGNDPLEHGERMQAVFAWLDEAQALARQRDGLVVLMHANPFLSRRIGADGYTGVRERLRRLGEAMPGKVLLVHGDTHQFRDDEPLPGLRRIEVFGSPHIRWAKARVERTGAKRFSVEPGAQ